MGLHVLEKLAETNPECEIWFDSSPLIYRGWASGLLATAPAEKRGIWAAQLARLYDPETAAATGQMGFRGVTTNPPLSLQAIQADPQFWTAEIHRLLAASADGAVEEVYWALYLEIVRHGAAMIRPVWDASGGRYGYLSGQVDSRLVSDRAQMLAQGLQLAAIAPNVMVKIPGSAEGYQVIEDLTARGISTNNTTSFTVAQYRACRAAVSRGLERARSAGVDLSRWRSVITHMSSRLGNLGDLKSEAEARGIALSPSDIMAAEMAVMKRAYREGRDAGHPSKMLQCSMRVQDAGPGGMAASPHIADLAGGDFVYTCPPGFIAQLMAAEDRLPAFDAGAVDRDAPPEVMARLLRLPYFRKAYDPDGMEPAEFTQFAAFVATAGEFAAATRKTVDFVARTIEPVMRRTG